MTMPNFLIIGAAKSGTTALYRFLDQHPQIYMSPRKQPDFLAFEGKRPNYHWPGGKLAHVNRNPITSIEEYRALFEGVTDEISIGEASPSYLYISKAAEHIRQRLPDVKLIAILRDPVERAYSNYCHLARTGDEPFTDFLQAFRAEQTRILDNWAPFWHYKQMGLYYAQLKRYFDMFDREQIRVYLYEDLNANPLDVLQDIFRFLKVDDTFVSDVSSRYNVARTPRIRALQRFLVHPSPIKSILRPILPEKPRRYLGKGIRGLNLVPGKPPLSPEVRRELIQEFRDDILKLQDLIQRDLSRWLE